MDVSIIRLSPTGIELVSSASTLGCEGSMGLLMAVWDAGAQAARIMKSQTVLRKNFDIGKVFLQRVATLIVNESPVLADV
jgi:hypothetical protein